MRAGTPALVIFQGPQSYVSPSWYATKVETGKVVPTWNYVMVQARGTPRVVDNAGWIRAQIEGKWKVNQNHPEANRQGVVDGLRREGGDEAMARLVAERGWPGPARSRCRSPSPRL